MEAATTTACMTTVGTTVATMTATTTAAGTTASGTTAGLTIAAGGVCTIAGTIAARITATDNSALVKVWDELVVAILRMIVFVRVPLVVPSSCG